MSNQRERKKSNSCNYTDSSSVRTRINSRLQKDFDQSVVESRRPLNRWSEGFVSLSFFCVFSLHLHKWVVTVQYGFGGGCKRGIRLVLVEHLHVGAVESIHV